MFWYQHVLLHVYIRKSLQNNMFSPPTDSFSELKAQAPLPPKLTVNPLVITETDSVTLNCQTPSSVSVSECYFVIERRPARGFSCLKTLTGTELLTMSHQSSPAEVKVTCSYLKASQSPESDTSSIIIRISLPPKLTVNPLVINETDSVTLNCQAPSSVSVSHCLFYTLNGGSMRDSSCLQTLTGTELLKVSNQNKWTSSAKVEVTCFYTVKFGKSNSPSPHSDTSSITIHILTPQMSLQRFPGEYVLFTCTLPGSANPDTRCNLYFGEGRSPVNTTTTILNPKTTTTNQWFCQFSVTIDELLSRLRSVQQRDASCDYSVGSEPNSLSPRSDGYSLADVMEMELRTTQTIPTFSTTTGTTALTAGRPSASSPETPAEQTSVQPIGTSSITTGFGSTFRTTVEPASKIWILRSAAAASGCGVALGIVMLVLAGLWNRRRAGPEEVKRQQPQSENYETYHMYAAISEEPPAVKDMVYTTVQAH
uniref:uncharacterized protein PB18E9.04c-like isoform X2 n=1 Tax=Scatophagus argus TaxID=75038 RepID=UPI001ED82E47|nr:uncharacterized protein PB18E9.04c-like isoform X2 [Scatophagus argus]